MSRPSKNKTVQKVSVNFTTAIVGIVETFEQNFGYLWGHGKPEHEKTQAEKEWYEVWKETRLEIFDKGTTSAGWLRLISRMTSNT